jgi:putative transposase
MSAGTSSGPRVRGLGARFVSRVLPLFKRRTREVGERLGDDWERLVTFYQFPREHWRHLRPAHVVESPLAAVRLRTPAAKRFTKVDAATAMIWKVLHVAETTFRRLRAPEHLPGVYARAQYVYGFKQHVSTHQEVAA